MQFQLLMSSRLVRRSHSEDAECVYSVLVTERREGARWEEAEEEEREVCFRKL